MGISQRLPKLEENVIRSFQLGDPKSFEKIYHYYYFQVYQRALQFTGKEYYAKDIVQEVFLKVYKHRKSLNNKEALCSWILRITYHCCIDNDKKNKRDAIFYVNEYEEGYLERYCADRKQKNMMDNIQMKFDLNLIVRCLSLMGDSSMKIGYLRFFKELSIKEIADIMEVPIGTVKSRIFRIKEVLQQELRTYSYH